MKTYFQTFIRPACGLAYYSTRIIPYESLSLFCDIVISSSCLKKFADLQELFLIIIRAIDRRRKAYDSFRNLILKSLIKIETKLIIFRGNSGSGKTTIAKLLQKSLGVRNTAYLTGYCASRDVDGTRLAREYVNRVNQKTTTYFSNCTCEVVNLERTLKKQVYEELLLDLVDYFDYHLYAYYFEIPFTETIDRHKLRSSTKEFGEARLNTWWIPHD